MTYPRSLPLSLYGVGCERATTFAKERTPLAHFADGLIGRLSLHEHDVAHLTFNFYANPPTESASSFMNVPPWQLSTWSPPPPSKMDWMD